MAPTTSLEQFKQTLSKNASIVTPNSENYQESIQRWATSAERPASIVVFPTTPEDVSKSVLFAQANKLELAIKGGGHATSGSSSTEGRLCIDLAKMRSVTVDKAKQTVTAQGGALWGDVDAEAGKYDLACVGGTVNHTGIGGLTLGGGYGFLTGEYGLVIDNLLEVEYVLANGSIVTASSTKNTDLFWAARGAGANFGVATSFTYQAHDQPNTIWGGMMIFPKSEFEKVIDFANYAVELPTGKHTVVFGITTPPPVGFPVVIAAVTYNGPAEEATEFYAPLLSLQILVNTTTSMPYSQINTIINDSVGFGLRRTMKGSAFQYPLTYAQASSIFTSFEEFTSTTVPDAVATVILFEFVCYHKLIAVKQTDTAFANRGAYGNIVFVPGWLDAQFDMACREWTRVMAGKCKEAFLEAGKAKGQDGVGEYSNYDSLNTSGEVLFGVNYPRLKELKKVYDPENVFGKGPNLLV